MSAVQSPERRAEAEGRPGARRLEVRRAPVRGRPVVARVPGPGEDRLAERAPGAEAPRVGEHGREAEEAGPRRSHQRRVARRDLEGAPDRRADHPALMLGHEDRPLRVAPVGLELRLGLLGGLRGQPREDRRALRVPGQDALELRERGDVLPLREADDQLASRDDGEVARRRLANGVEVLLAEVEAEPRVDEGHVRRRDEDVVVRPPRGDPLRRGDGVQLAHDLGLGGRMPGRIDPDVLRAPQRVRLRAAHDVAHGGAVPVGDPRGRAPGFERRRDLATGGLGRFERRIHRRLGEPVPAMAIGQELGRSLEVRRCERPDRRGVTSTWWSSEREWYRPRD